MTCIRRRLIVLPGYHRLAGSRATVQELTDIFTTLELNGLLKPTRVLTGYIPSRDVLRAVGNVIVQLKQTKPDIIYLLDRVLSLFFSTLSKIC
jgi:pyridoxine kinase